MSRDVAASDPQPKRPLARPACFLGLVLVALLLGSALAWLRRAGDPGSERIGALDISPEARRVLEALDGAAITYPVGGASWTIRSRHPVFVMGGADIRLERDGERRWLRLETDGDVADLHQRVRGKPAEGIGGSPSPFYLGSWGAAPPK